jgi:hypothetical protein
MDPYKSWVVLGQGLDLQFSWVPALRKTLNAPLPLSSPLYSSHPNDDRVGFAYWPVTVLKGKGRVHAHFLYPLGNHSRMCLPECLAGQSLPFQVGK